MQVLYPRCCGLDIHKKTVVACVLLTEPDGTTRRFVRTFGTMTGDLLALGDWLSLHEVVHVAMESTGVLWRPVFNVLEEGRTLLLVNAEPHQSRPRPKNGRKGQRVASRPPAPRAVASKLYSSPTDPGPARSDAISQEACRAAHPGDQSRPQGAGNS